ncbi:MAG TPA: nucleoside diphosphate kinase regulator [Reyranella sp.]|nr:nucleoside diphosphate kinase regulator [Reyranella sp.]
MREDQSNRPMPRIVVSESDHERLTGLATAALNRLPETAQELLAEMERAEIVSAPSVPANVVRMGSRVTFLPADGRKRRITLVFPAEEDITKSRVSIMTPIGAALIGLTEGQSIQWTARDGRRHELTVLTVEKPPAP